jgi:hypothetical protein
MENEGLRHRPQQTGRAQLQTGNVSRGKHDEDKSRALLGLSFAFASCAIVSEKFRSYGLLLSLGCIVGCWLTANEWAAFSAETSFFLKAVRSLQMLCSCLILSQDFFVAASLLCFTVAIIYATTDEIEDVVSGGEILPPASRDINAGRDIKSEGSRKSAESTPSNLHRSIVDKYRSPTQRMRDGSRQNGVYSPSYFVDDAPHAVQTPDGHHVQSPGNLPVHASPRNASPKTQSPFYNSPRPGQAQGYELETLPARSPGSPHVGSYGHCGYSPHDVLTEHHQHREHGTSSSPYNGQNYNYTGPYGSDGGVTYPLTPTSPYNHASSPMGYYNSGSPYHNNHGVMQSPASQSNEMSSGSPRRNPCVYCSDISANVVNSRIPKSVLNCNILSCMSTCF